MLLELDLNNPTEIPDVDLRAVVVAVLSKALFDGLVIPERIKLSLVTKPIIRVVGGRRVERSGELGANDDPNQNHIRIYAGPRSHSQVIQTLFHEVTHLIRICNSKNILDLALEETSNEADMDSTRPAVELLAAVLIMDSTDSLRGLRHAEDEQDSGVGVLVREGDTGSGVGLPV